jgi:hypothetical protein
METRLALRVRRVAATAGMFAAIALSLAAGVKWY